MYRDPSEFRERFKAYKDGKSVREIYGLPGYAEGTVGTDPELDMIKKFEQWRDKTYLDSKNIPTIGWGFTDTSLVSKGKMSREEGDRYLLKIGNDAKKYLRNKLGPRIWDNLDTATKAALLSYHHNYPAGFGDNTRFMKHWRARRYNEAVSEIDAGMNDPTSPGLKPRRLEEQATIRKDSFLFPKIKPQKPADSLVLKTDVTKVATIPTIQLKAIDYADRRNTFMAEAERAMWAHTAFENMPKISDMPIWKYRSLPALTPVEYDVIPLKTYSKGKVAEEDEPVITQGRAGSRLDKLDRMMDPDADDNTATRVAKKVGKGFTSIAQDAKKMFGLEAADRFATHTQRPEDYVDALFLAAGTMMIPRMIKALRLPMIKDFVKHFDDMDARELGKYFFQEHPELMTLPQEAWYEELAKKSDDYFRQAIHRRAKLFEKEGRSVGPESIATKVAPDIKIAPITGSKYGGVYSPTDNTMLINSDRVKDPRTALRVFNHEKAHSMLTAFEDAVGLPYPTTYGALMELLFRYSPEYRAAHPGVHLGLETDASLHEGKSLRAYDTELLGKLLDIDFKNMTDDEFYSYMNNGYFKNLKLSIPKGAKKLKEFVGKLKDGKLPGYEDGLASKLKNFVKNIFVQRDEKEDKKVQEDISNLAKTGSHSMQRALQRSPDFAIPAAVDFVLTYYNSPGFAERLQKMKNNISEYANSKYNAGVTEYSEYNKGNLKLGSITLNHKLDENAEYNHGTGNITYGDLSGKDLKNEYGAVIAHELGHAIDSSMGIDGRGFPSYSNTILPFRRGFLYRINEKWLEENSNKKAVEDWRKCPEEFPYELHHDRMPFEYYADLVAFRYWLLLAGIYDSTKANNPFTREHLDKLYHDSIFGKFEDRPLPVRRFMTEFDWDDIVKIMNDVAYVDKTNNDVLYAANGKLPGYSNGKIRIKPANRGKFNATKKRTGKTTEELTHSKNPLTRKRAIFALNAKKWNHK